MGVSDGAGHDDDIPYLTPEQAATLLGCSVGLIYELLKQEKLKGFRLGRRWRIPRKAIDEFIDGGGSGERDPSP
jgi:excisionase family DNA binding protein